MLPSCISSATLLLMIGSAFFELYFAACPLRVLQQNRHLWPRLISVRFGVVEAEDKQQSTAESAVHRPLRRGRMHSQKQHVQCHGANCIEGWPATLSSMTGPICQACKPVTNHQLHHPHSRSQLQGRQPRNCLPCYWLQECGWCKECAAGVADVQGHVAC